MILMSISHMQELIQADNLQGGSEVVDFQPFRKIL